MKINWLASLLWLLVTMPTVMAQEGKGYPIGGTITSFKLKNVDERLVSLDDYKVQKGVIVVFTCNHCPFSKAYEDRLIALDRKFTLLGYPVLAIMPNDPVAYLDDSFENMKIRARDKAYSFPYLIDETQTVTKAFGASRTPQAYVLKKVADHFALEYAGAIDDNPQDPAGVQRRYIDEVVTMLLGGPPTALITTKAIGCGIKWK